MMFRNRKEAGEELALLLKDYKDKNALVLGIPRGGVEVAWYVAKHLHADLSVIISKKLPYPGMEEYGFGAVCEQNEVYVDIEKNIIEEKTMKAIIREREKEIMRRIALYRNNKPIPEIKDRIVILVDDGIATGVTLVPALRLCKKCKAAKVIIGAPVAGLSFDPHLMEADEMKIVFQPPFFMGVSQAYKSFEQLSDNEVLSFLKNHRYIDHGS